jgi:hypothetical protein
MKEAAMKCEGCEGELNPMEALLAAGDRVAVCMECVKARARAAMTHRCGCGKKKRPTGVLGRPRQRQWIACHRCLGTIKQVA